MLFEGNIDNVTIANRCGSRDEGRDKAGKGGAREKEGHEGGDNKLGHT